MFIRIPCIASLWLLIVLSSVSLGINGSGTEPNPFIIANRADFNAFCASSAYWASGVYTRLGADIDLSDTIYTRAPIAYNPEQNFLFIGTPYKGNFDGNGYKITGLNIIGVQYLGLFGKIDTGAVIERLSVENW